MQVRGAAPDGLPGSGGQACPAGVEGGSVWGARALRPAAASVSGLHSGHGSLLSQHVSHRHDSGGWQALGPAAALTLPSLSGQQVA